MSLYPLMTRLNAYSVSNRRHLSLEQFTQHLAEFEQLVGMKLPPAYVDFVSRWGAFAVDAQITNTDLSPAVFLGFTTPTDAYDLRRVWHTFRGRIPEWQIGIAIDDFGNLLTLEPESGRVLFFDHETQALQAVADDFNSFCEMLEPLPEDGLAE